MRSYRHVGVMECWLLSRKHELLSSSAKKLTDETLLLELARRGYNLFTVGGLYKPDSTDTAEIVVS